MVVLQLVNQSGKKKLKIILGGENIYLPIKYKYIILTTLVFIIPYIIFMYGYIVQTETQQKELYIRNKLETLEKTDYLYSSLSLSKGSFNEKVYHEFLTSSLDGYSDIIILGENREEIHFTNNSHIVNNPEYFNGLDKSRFNSYEIEYLNVHRVLMYSYNVNAKKYYIIVEPTKNALNGIKRTLKTL